MDEAGKIGGFGDCSEAQEWTCDDSKRLRYAEQTRDHLYECLRHPVRLVGEPASMLGLSESGHISLTVEVKGEKISAMGMTTGPLVNGLPPNAWRDKAIRLESQLPEGMKHCTIVLRQCDAGHSSLTATNWIDHGCPHCRANALLERARLFCELANEAREDLNRLQLSYNEVYDRMTAAERRLVAYDEELAESVKEMLAAKDARIAELDSELARRPAAFVDPEPEPVGHNPFRDFGGDRRRIGGRNSRAARRRPPISTRGCLASIRDCVPLDNRKRAARLVFVIGRGRTTTGPRWKSPAKG
jgi:hypothetical protein